MTLLARCITLACLVFPLVGLAQDEASLQLPKVDRIAIDRLLPGPAGQEIVEITLRVLGKDGEAIEELRTADLRVWQSDDPVDRGDLTLLRLDQSNRTLSSVFVIDRRPTIDAEAFERGVETVRNFVERAGRSEEVAVVAFGGSVEVVVRFGTPPRQAVDALMALQREAGGAASDFFSSAVSAIDLLRRDSSGGDGFVVLVSPGVGADGGVMKVVDASMGKEREAKIPVFALTTPSAGANGMAALRSIAEGTAGGFEQVAPRDFNSAVNRIWRQMSGRYLLRFPADMDGRRHRIDIEIQGVLGSVKAGYPTHGSTIPWRMVAGVLAALLAIVGIGAFLVARSWSRPPRLVVLNGEQAGNVIALSMGTHRIGSLPTNEIHLASPGVSRHHAEVTVAETSVQIRDLQSKNGTRVNGALRELSPLLPGDRLEFADVRMVFESGPRSKGRRSSEL